MRTLLLVACFTAAVLAVPQISCSFTATVNDNQATGKVYSYTQYYDAVNNRYATIGDQPNAHAGNSTIIVIPPSTYIYQNPFFDRYVCSVLPLSGSYSCYTVDNDAKNTGNGPCPNEPGTTCNIWVHKKFLSKKVDTFYMKGPNGNVPDKILMMDGNTLVRQVDFLSFDPNVPADWIFDPPAGCSDFTSSSVNDADHLFRDVDGTPVATEAGKTLINDMQNIARINAEAKTWKAAQKRWAGMTHEDLRRTLTWPSKFSFGTGPVTRGPKVGVSGKKVNVGDIPQSWTAMGQWPNCIGPIRDQAQCGSCWAFSGAESLGDRTCIAKGLSAPLVLSPQYILDCFKDQTGCNGGFPDTEWVDMTTTGTVPDSCYPYAGVDQTCPNKCRDGSALKLYYAQNAYSIWDETSLDNTVKLIQIELMANGPMEVAYWVFSDFESYSGGVYKRTSGAQFAGGHAVKLVGWGVDSATNTPYWTIANSWGPDWGEKGFFRIIRGVNDCLIEQQIATGLPKQILDKS